MVEKALAIDLSRRVEVLDDMLGYFSDAPEAAIRLQVAIALSSKAGTLERMFRIEERDIAFAELLRRFAEAPEHEIRAHVARSLLWRARDALVKVRGDHVVEVLDDLLRRYADDGHPAVAAAMFDRARALAKMGPPASDHHSPHPT